jgi:hypothetical protein
MIAMIWGSLYLVIFIQNLLMRIGEKILLPQPLTFGGITDESALLAVAEGRLCSFVGCTPGITSKSASFAGRTGVQIESPRACGMIMKHLQQK